jgi:hypothetical protein
VVSARAYDEYQANENVNEESVYGYGNGYVVGKMTDLFYIIK